MSISGGVNMPVGNFSSTHWAGIGLTAAPANSRYNLNKDHTIAFFYEGGAAYYLGKKEIISGHAYTYPGYTFIHAFAGISILPQKNTRVLAALGPALGLYNGNMHFNAGASLTANYYISNNIILGPSITLMKEFGTNTLWAASLKATFYFLKNTGGGIRF
jgi:hypothetical protein